MTLSRQAIYNTLLFGFILFIIPVYIILSPVIDNSNIVFKQNNNAFIVPPHIELENYWVDSVISKMTLDEKIGQLLMVAAYPQNGDADKQRMTEIIKKYKIGGIIFFKSGPVLQANLTNYYQSISETPIMIAGDYEWGLAMRMDSTINFPRQMTLGSIKNNKLIYDFGAEVARQCNRMAININFAPVIDINNNAQNPVINDRSFGEDKINVTNKAIAYMFGLQDNKVMATGKHFPGHGDTDIDSHKDLPIIYHSKQRLDSLELYPFKKLINRGLSAVMIAHLNIPALEKNLKIPASLSKPIVTDLLKKELNFKGLIFTDALGMHGVTKFHKAGEAEVLALIAGTDVLLMPENIAVAVDAIKIAVANKKISISEINNKVKKILKSKKWFKLDKFTPIDTKNLYKDLNSDYAKNLYRQIIEASITTVKNNNNILPLNIDQSIKTASISIGNGYISNFQDELKLYENTFNTAVRNNAEISEFNQVYEKIKNYDRIIISIHNIKFKETNYNISQNSINLINKIAEKKDLILVCFGTPYALSLFDNPQNIKAVILGYTDIALFRKFAAQAIYGGIKTDAKIPVSAGKFLIPKKEITTEKIRLKYTDILELNIDSVYIAKIDSVMHKAIADGATPGATILAAKEGKVFYYKSFGYHTYEKKTKTKNSDLYDLASLTKILATTASIMKLHEEKKIDINKKLSTYLTELDSTNKKNIVIKEILAHQAGLASWIPFYLKTFDKNNKTMLDKKIYSTVKNDTFSVQVAENLFILNTYVDSIYQRIMDSEIKENHKYKYSDLGFYMLYRLIEKVTGEKFEDYTQKNFYSSLGAYSLGFKPLEKFPKSQIIPTEIDNIFRKQVLQGYVHDYGAAMTGGVNGHAGLFANANDVAKIMQMFLQEGSYGNKKYFKPSTVKLFTTCAYCDNDNRRALGFDRVLRGEEVICSQYTSDSAFGHSGFTGTFVWADPEQDFVYVFFSNRVYPNSENNLLSKMNIRTKVHDLFYLSFPKIEFETQYIN